MSRGYVYVLSNPAMPGYLKIGYSCNGGIQRGKAIEGTGVPLPFKLEFEIFVDDAPSLEKQTHLLLADVRVSNDREFFQCNPSDAIAAVLECYVESRGKKTVWADEVEAIEAALTWARIVDQHPFIVCESFSFLEKESVEAALKRREEWLAQVSAQHQEDPCRALEQ